MPAQLGELAQTFIFVRLWTYVEASLVTPATNMHMHAFDSCRPGSLFVVLIGLSSGFPISGIHTASMHVCMQDVMLSGLLQRLQRSVLQDAREEYFSMLVQHRLCDLLLRMLTTLSVPMELDLGSNVAGVCRANDGGVHVEGKWVETTTVF